MTQFALLQQVRLNGKSDADMCYECKRVIHFHTISITGTLVDCVGNYQGANDYDKRSQLLNL